MSPRHRELTGAAAAHPPGIVSDVDPGDIGAGKLWIDNSSGVGPFPMWIRNDTNDDWIAVGSTLDAALTALNATDPDADMLPYYTGVATADLTAFTAYMRTLLDDADAATARATLGIAIGSNVQAYNANLAAIAGLTTASDKLSYWTGSGAAALTTLSSFVRTLLDDADAATFRTTLGLGALAVLSSLAHSALTGIGANDHHNQGHVLATNAALGADHTVSGLTAGQVLRASGATTALFQALVQADIGGLTTADTPTFTGVNIGNADTTIARVAAGKISIEGVGSIGTVPVTTVLTGSGNYSLPSGCTHLRVIMVGGGGGGGSVATTAAGEAANGAGGGGGGWCEAYLDASTLDASIAYVVGGGGTAGTAGGNGGAGSDSTFGAAGKSYRMVAKGGSGGATSASSNGTIRPVGGNGGAAGTVPTGGFTGVGDDGGHGLVAGGLLAAQGWGGGSRLGGITKGPTTSAAGNAGAQYGGGGSGGANIASQATARDGGAGAAGTIIVTAFSGF